MKISYAPAFTREYKKLEPALQCEVKEKIKLFTDRRNHKTLKVHKLHGKFKRFYGFSVNYRYRIAFMWLSKDEAVLLVIGDHAVYD